MRYKIPRETCFIILVRFTTNSGSVVDGGCLAWCKRTAAVSRGLNPVPLVYCVLLRLGYFDGGYCVVLVSI